MSDPHAVLGLGRGASKQEVKQRFKALAMEFHPDRHASSSPAEQSVAAARFKTIKEAYEMLTDDRKRMAYEASSRSAGAYQYHSTNTDWARRETDWAAGGGRGGYTSRMSGWEALRRGMRMNVRNFDATLHLGLGAILLSGFLVFEYVHNSIWRLKNVGKSFEELQARQRAAAQGGGTARAAAVAAASAGGPGAGAQGDSATAGSTGAEPGRQPWRISSAWADNMRGRFIDDPDAGSSAGAAPAANRPPRDGKGAPPPATPAAGSSADSKRVREAYIDKAVIQPVPSPPGQMRAPLSASEQPPPLPAWLWAEDPANGARNTSNFISQLRSLYQRSIRAREMAATHTHAAMDPCPMLGDGEEAWDDLPSSSDGALGPLGGMAARLPLPPPPAAGPMLPPPPCSFLAAGVHLAGTQRLTQLGARRREEDWRVQVSMQEVDLQRGELCGVMEAQNVPGARNPIVTFWMGHIIDNVNHKFITGGWGAGRDSDMRHWSRFEGFAAIRGEVLHHQGRCPDLAQHPYVYMRWKERNFMHNSCDGGLTIAGFYYIQLDRRNGSVRGLYFDPASSPFQELDLTVQQGPLGGYAFSTSSLR